MLSIKKSFDYDLLSSWYHTPSVTCIDNISQTVELGITSVVVFYTEPSATDISGSAFLQSRSNAPGDNFPVGTTVVTYVFTDASGNDADACVFTVTVSTGKVSVLSRKSVMLIILLRMFLQIDFGRVGRKDVNLLAMCHNSEVTLLLQLVKLISKWIVSRQLLSRRYLASTLHYLQWLVKQQCE